MKLKSTPRSVALIACLMTAVPFASAQTLDLAQPATFVSGTGYVVHTIRADTRISNLDLSSLDLSSDVIDFYKKVLNPVATGVSAQGSAYDPMSSWGTVNSALVLRIPAVPEPGTYALMGLGLLGVAWAARRRPTKG